MTPHDDIDWNAYVDAIGGMIGLPIATVHLDATIAQLKLNAAIVRPLLAFDIPEGTDPAPVFKP